MRLFKLPHNGAHIDLDSVQAVYPVTFEYHGYDTIWNYLLEVQFALRDSAHKFRYEYDNNHYSPTRETDEKDARRRATEDREALIAAWGKDAPVVAG